MNAVIFDIDGTLADVDHRRHFVEKGRKNWKSFLDAMVHDTPKVPIVNMLLVYKKADYKILLVTGRGEEHQTHTMDWLDKNGIPYDGLFMRPAGNFDSDTTIKENIYQQSIRPKYKVELVVDDRDSVVAMRRSIGLTCLQCELGAF